MASLVSAGSVAPISPLPVLVVRRGGAELELLASLANDPRASLLHVEGDGAAWLPLRATASCIMAIAERNPLDALGYVVTAGVRCPIVIGCVHATAQERAAVLDAGAAACVELPLSRTDADAVLTLCSAPPEDAERRPPLLYLDLVRHGAYHGSRHARLTRREFAVLHTLQERGGPVAAADLLMDVWGCPTPTRQNLEFYIHQLRRKLAHAGLPVTIRTVRGYGYALDAADPDGRRSRASVEDALSEKVQRLPMTRTWL